MELDLHDWHLVSLRMSGSEAELGFALDSQKRVLQVSSTGAEVMLLGLGLVLPNIIFRAFLHDLEMVPDGFALSIREEAEMHGLRQLVTFSCCFGGDFALGCRESLAVKENAEDPNAGPVYS